MITPKLDNVVNAWARLVDLAKAQNINGMNAIFKSETASNKQMAEYWSTVGDEYLAAEKIFTDAARILAESLGIDMKRFYPEPGQEVQMEVPKTITSEQAISPRYPWRETYQAVPSSDNQNMEHNGKKFIVLEDITDPTVKTDPMYGYVRTYRIRLEDGRELVALEVEVEQLETDPLPQKQTPYDRFRWGGEKISFTDAQNYAVLAFNKLMTEGRGLNRPFGELLRALDYTMYELANEECLEPAQAAERVNALKVN